MTQTGFQIYSRANVFYTSFILTTLESHYFRVNLGVGFLLPTFSVHVLLCTPTKIESFVFIKKKTIGGKFCCIEIRPGWQVGVQAQKAAATAE